LGKLTSVEPKGEGFRAKRKIRGLRGVLIENTVGVSDRFSGNARVNKEAFAFRSAG